MASRWRRGAGEEIFVVLDGEASVALALLHTFGGTLPAIGPTR